MLPTLKEIWVAEEYVLKAKQSLWELGYGKWEQEGVVSFSRFHHVCHMVRHREYVEQHAKSRTGMPLNSTQGVTPANSMLSQGGNGSWQRCWARGDHVHGMGTILGRVHCRTPSHQKPTNYCASNSASDGVHLDPGSSQGLAKLRRQAAKCHGTGAAPTIYELNETIPYSAPGEGCVGCTFAEVDYGNNVAKNSARVSSRGTVHESVFPGTPKEEIVLYLYLLRFIRNNLRLHNGHVERKILRVRAKTGVRVGSGEWERRTSRDEPDDNEIGVHQQYDPSSRQGPHQDYVRSLEGQL